MQDISRLWAEILVSKSRLETLAAKDAVAFHAQILKVAKPATRVLLSAARAM